MLYKKLEGIQIKADDLEPVVTQGKLPKGVELVPPCHAVDRKNILQGGLAWFNTTNQMWCPSGSMEDPYYPWLHAQLAAKGWEVSTCRICTNIYGAWSMHFYMTLQEQNTYLSFQAGTPQELLDKAKEIGVESLFLGSTFANKRSIDNCTAELIKEVDSSNKENHDRASNVT